MGCENTRGGETARVTYAKMDAVEEELSKIVGLDGLKLQLRNWFKGMLLDTRRRDLGLKIGPRSLPHMAFLGNPGTGKTMIARVLGKLLQMVGILPTSNVTEVQRTDLVGEYIGHTGPKTRAKIKEAEGGILFVDEAYRLIPKDSMSDFGKEALEEIMSFMNSGNVVVIFAGYSEPMERVISSNEGLRRRVTNFFHFDDFSCEDLARILHLKMSSKDEKSILYGFKLHPSCSVEFVAAMLERQTTEKQRRVMNGGLVDQMLVKAKENLDSRIDVGCTDIDSLLTITSDDLSAGLWLLKSKEKRKIPENTCINADDKMDALEKELSKIVGMEGLKLQLKNWLKGMLLDKQCQALGLEVGALGYRKPPHMVFIGNPGTGKTMVARVVAKLMHMVGILPTDKVTEVQRTDLVAQYICQTGPKTRAKILEAEGGVLFIDEAYHLMPKDSHGDFGLEALEDITSFMDSGDVVVIFAGYSEPMERVISSNEDFRRRVTNFFHFDDFSCEDLAKILHLKISKNSPFCGFKLHPSCSVKAVAAMIKQQTTVKQRKEMNGGLVDQMLVKAIENLDSRISVGCTDKNSLVTITSEDLAAGLLSLKAKEKRVMPENTNHRTI